MWIQRTTFPEEGDLVLCTVTNIQHNSVFVTIHEYNRQGMIPISEIAPGRIRNIRDYVIEGKIVTCKILNVNAERGYIDLSLRRVSESQRRQKGDEVKQELRAEKIVELTAHALKIDPKQLYAKLTTKLLKSYFYMYQAFDDVLAETINLKDFVSKEEAEMLLKQIKDKIKPKELIVAGDVAITIWEEGGLEIVRATLLNAKKVSDKLKIIYLGGGKYRLIIKGIDYKEIEKILKDASEVILTQIKKAKGKAEYERVKNISLEHANA
ncbi:MAG: S1 RNA-binding domain-containing protein [Candidatus Woesearchaeota archaeon]